jgi:DNA-binding LytR/AlgR family response regulator
MTLRCYIVDDEESAISVLTHYISQTPYLELVGSNLDPVDALAELQKLEIDLVFLDIHMPKISGLDVVKILGNKVKVIMTTAYSEYAMQGFELEVSDYLLKPIPYDRFLKSTQKVLDAMLPKVADAKPVAAAPSTPVEESDNDFIFVKTESKGKFLKINFKDIAYVEGLKNYVSIFVDNERIITLLTMKELEERLEGKGFIRVHKSYIVALNRIKGVDGNQILIGGKLYVPLGDSYRETFFKMLDQYLIGSQKK